MAEQKIRAALDRHWAASDANDFEGEHQIYREDAVLEYPQSGERIRGRQNIQLSRAAQPNRKRFTVRRIIGAGVNSGVKCNGIKRNGFGRLFQVRRGWPGTVS